jgi:hypothetical protein
MHQRICKVKTSDCKWEGPCRGSRNQDRRAEQMDNHNTKRVQEFIGLTLQLGLSSRRRIPIITEYGREYYPWQLADLLTIWSKLRRISRQIKKYGLAFSACHWQTILVEWAIWDRCYRPTISLPLEKCLVLDAGAGEGETVLFYYLLGFRNFRCIESDRTAFSALARNCRSLSDAKFDLRNQRFQGEDALAVDFAKIDVEGGEIELIKVPPNLLPKEIVIETHGRKIETVVRKHLSGMKHQMTLIQEPEAVILWRWLNPQKT